MSARVPTIVGVVVLFFFFPFSVLSAVNFIPLGVTTANPIIGDSFVMQASASGAVSGSKYFVKCRIGPSSTSLTEGQTFNGQTNTWLDDTGSNGAWVDMPQIVVGEDGSWQGSVTCRIKSSAIDEAKLLFLRACPNVNDVCGTSIQSGSSLALAPLMPTPTNTPIPTNTPVPTNTPIPTSTPSNTSVPTTTPTPIASPTKKPTATPITTSTIELGSTIVASPTGVVLGAQDPQTPNNKPYIIALLFVSVGCALLAAVFVVKNHLYLKK